MSLLIQAKSRRGEVRRGWRKPNLPSKPPIRCGIRRKETFSSYALKK
jgi:hypothetical protein